jgi:hypothetical protein
MPTINSDITVNVDIEVEVYCAKCGAGLCKQSTSGKTRGRSQPFIEVEPCEKCLDKIKDEGYSDGYAEGEKNTICKLKGVKDGQA